MKDQPRPGYTGLKLMRTGAPRYNTPPTPNSKTQRRKRALANYTLVQRQYGEQAK